MRGRIIASSCGTYQIYIDGLTYLGKPRGKIRHRAMKPFVGDFVEYAENEQLITDIYHRSNFLIRPSVANVDGLAIVMSTSEPEFSSTLINKFLSYANYFNIKAYVIITKMDKTYDKVKVQNAIDALHKLDVEVLTFSKVDHQGLNAIQTLFNHKVIALMGQTGVGKSSLMNALIPQSHRAVGEYSKALGRGKHMTKEVIMIPYLTGFIADTPGFSSLELPFFKEDLASCFPGFAPYAVACKFADCLHLNAKECAIVKAVEEGKIDCESFDDYQKILAELKLRKDRY